jgi:hypothetical protein
MKSRLTQMNRGWIQINADGSAEESVVIRAIGGLILV